MGDRTNPIKFGPEWLRNLARERSIGVIGAQAGGTRAAAAPPGMGSPPVANRPATSPPTNSPKVLLARLRYGREEMLALYDRQTAEAPAQLKTNDILYVPRGQPPYALNNSFEDDTRDNMNRHSGTGGLLAPSDRYTGVGRGRGMGPSDKNRGIPPGDKGKIRPFNRPAIAGRGWHNQRNAYSGIPDDDPNQPTRLWTNNTHQPPTGLRPNNGEQPEWQPKSQQYRMKRQTSTNWRQQHGREEGEEWRSADGVRRPQEKWEWGWQQEASNRPNQEKQWHNRRGWTGGEGNEDSLPEWAVDNAEACGGTFDSSGAFHGYSNDDSNIPKQQEVPYPLIKSHTHGSFTRTKMADEGLEEWWASEKAKKLSPKRFDASNVHFKKPSKGNAEEKSNSNPATAKTSVADDPSLPSTGAIPKRTYKAITTSSDKPVKEKPAQSSTTKKGNDSPEIKASIAAQKQTEENTQNKTEDGAKEKMLPSNSEHVNEKGNFQSVILTSNNTLRQKHQNIVVTPTETPKRQPKLIHYLEKANQPRKLESDASGLKNRKETDNDKIVEDILRMNLDEGIPSATINQLLINHSNSSMDSAAQIPYPPMQMRMTSTLQGLNSQTNQNAQHATGMPSAEGYNGMIQQNIGMTNSMLNASLGLPMPNPSTGMAQVMPPTLSNTGLSNPNALASGHQVMGGVNLQQPGLQQGNMQAVGMQNSQMQGIHMQGLQGFGMQSVAALQNQMGGIANSGLQPGGSRLQSATNMISGMANNSLFNNQMQHGNDLNNFGNTVGDSASGVHRLQHMVPQPRNNAMYGNMMGQTPHISGMDLQQIISDQWYYEDPNKTIQGPFGTKEMFNWFIAGFFSPTLMVRRECDAVMRPLGSYGPLPFGPMGGVHPPYSMGSGYDLRPQQPHDAMMTPNQQPGLGVDVQSLWGQPTNNAANPDHNMWMQAMNNNQQNENPINNLPMYFWDSQPADIPATPLVPETIKTEEEILAQMRATQAQGPTSPLSFFADSPVAAQEVEANTANAALNVNQLQKLIQKDTASSAGAGSTETEQKLPEKLADAEQISSEVPTGKGNKTADKNADAKPTKEVAKVDNSKPKSKEATKQKSKKTKEEKKEENVEVKSKEEEIKVEKRSAEPSPSPKIKKEDKSNKKDLDKEKKEWIKEGFTIVKGTDKSKDKDTKKKVEEAKAAEEADRKRKEEEKLAAEERKRQLETLKKQQQEAGNQQALPSRQSLESVLRKAPWSGSTQVLQSSTRDGPTLAEIQRLEREKKLEQMKEQQHMMQLIAQQQAAALAREQEMQTGLGWAKKSTTPTKHQTLGEIQAEARKQAAAMAVAVASAAAASREEEVLITPPPVNTMPWANVHNGGAGFWDSPHPEPVKPVVKPAEVKAELKHKKKVTVMAPPKQENTPSVEFDMWCSNMLVSWRDTGIDVPTFVSFLRDIESPYEVKDYVKCYLGDSREASDFARQFLEKRSRLMRVGMVTPSDDLCSPAVAVNPRTNSGSDHAELKAKGKKPKKNKMLKVDARNILGFSVTASEDRINVGDIDTV